MRAALDAVWPEFRWVRIWLKVPSFGDKLQSPYIELGVFSHTVSRPGLCEMSYRSGTPIMLFRLALLVSMLVLGTHVQAGQATVLGRLIELAVPAGYCEAGKHPAEAEVVRRTKEGIGTSNEVLVMFANCRELDELRAGKRQLFDNYGQILIQRPKGQLRAIPGITRADYISKISGQAGAFPDAFKKAETRMRAFFPEYQSMENLGAIDKDENGLYVGLLLAITADTGQPRRIVGIVGLTLTRQLPVSLNLYQAYGSTPDLQALLTRQKAALAVFVQRNK